MRPLLSEFSFGYALTEDLASGALGPLIGAPIFPSLVQEGRPGGGFDLQLPLVGSPLFIQFKLSDYMKSRSAAEWHLFNRSYFRMHLRPARHSDQHNLLHTLEIAGEAVYYVAPHFHTTAELNTYYLDRTVLRNTIWIPPSSIGPLPDNDDHYIAFNRESGAYLCSKDPRRIEALVDINGVFSTLFSHTRRRLTRLRPAFFEKLARKLLRISGFSNNEVSEVMARRFEQSRLQGKHLELQFVAFLSRSLFNSELILLTDDHPLVYAN